MYQTSINCMGCPYLRVLDAPE